MISKKLQKNVLSWLKTQKEKKKSRNTLLAAVDSCLLKSVLQSEAIKSMIFDKVESGIQIRIANSLYCEKLRKRSLI